MGNQTHLVLDVSYLVTVQTGACHLTMLDSDGLICDLRIATPGRIVQKIEYRDTHKI